MFFHGMPPFGRMLHTYEAGERNMFFPLGWKCFHKEGRNGRTIRIIFERFMTNFTEHLDEKT